MFTLQPLYSLRSRVTEQSGEKELQTSEKPNIWSWTTYFPSPLKSFLEAAVMGRAASRKEEEGKQRLQEFPVLPAQFTPLLPPLLPGWLGPSHTAPYVRSLQRLLERQARKDLEIILCSIFYSADEGLRTREGRGPAGNQSSQYPAEITGSPPMLILPFPWLPPHKATVPHFCPLPHCLSDCLRPLLFSGSPNCPLRLCGEGSSQIRMALTQRMA